MPHLTYNWKRFWCPTTGSIRFDYQGFLVEVLQDLELKLQGETPAVRDIWDKTSQNHYKPVIENEFSDYVKRFLDQDLRTDFTGRVGKMQAHPTLFDQGFCVSPVDEKLKTRAVIVNREVELRAKMGSKDLAGIRIYITQWRHNL